jgi:hypothetical protein
MPQLPLPQRGQPLDVSYLYQMASTINDLVVQVSPTNSNNVKIKPVTGSPSSVPTASAAMYCETKNLFSNKDVTAGQTESFDIDFQFKIPPVVVATPWNKNSSSPDVSIFITNVTNSKATFVAKFSSNGKANVDVNIIAIGIPN